MLAVLFDLHERPSVFAAELQNNIYEKMLIQMYSVTTTSDRCW
jgi:hypothetical protein